MKTTISTWLLIASVCLWSRSSAGDTSIGKINAAATDPRLAMVAELQALDPSPSLGQQAKVFGRLIGAWDVEYTDYSKGKAAHRSGEFIVGWVMDGRATQDLWIVYPSGARKDREVYADVRYFDPKSGTWPTIFIDPEHASLARFTGGADGDDRIVFNTADLGHADNRWSFQDIRPDAFVFRDEASDDGGKTWRLLSEYHMKRRTVASSAR